MGVWTTHKTSIHPMESAGGPYSTSHSDYVILAYFNIDLLVINSKTQSGCGDPTSSPRSHTHMLSLFHNNNNFLNCLLCTSLQIMIIHIDPFLIATGSRKARSVSAPSLLRFVQGLDLITISPLRDVSQTYQYCLHAVQRQDTIDPNDSWCSPLKHSLHGV